MVWIFYFIFIVYNLLKKYCLSVEKVKLCQLVALTSIYQKLAPDHDEDAEEDEHKPEEKKDLGGHIINQNNPI